MNLTPERKAAILSKMHELEGQKPSSVLDVLKRSAKASASGIEKAASGTVETYKGVGRSGLELLEKALGVPILGPLLKGAVAGGVTTALTEPSPEGPQANEPPSARTTIREMLFRAGQAPIAGLAELLERPVMGREPHGKSFGQTVAPESPLEVQMGMDVAQGILTPSSLPLALGAVLGAGRGGKKGVGKVLGKVLGVDPKAAQAATDVPPVSPTARAVPDVPPSETPAALPPRVSEPAVVPAVSSLTPERKAAIKARMAEQAAEPTTTTAKSRFHGTSTPVEILKENTYSTLNYYGQGFYTTDDFAIAQGYSKKGKGGTPTIYDVAEKSKVNLFDMESPLTHELKVVLRGPLQDFDYILDEPNTKNLRQVYDRLREDLTDEGMSADTIQEWFDSIRHNLVEMGYDGLKHTGGLKTNRPPHEVKIYWNPRRQVEIKSRPQETTTVTTPVPVQPGPDMSKPTPIVEPQRIEPEPAQAIPETPVAPVVAAKPSEPPSAEMIVRRGPEAVEDVPPGEMYGPAPKPPDVDTSYRPLETEELPTVYTVAPKPPNYDTDVAVQALNAASGSLKDLASWQRFQSSTLADITDAADKIDGTRRGVVRQYLVQPVLDKKHDYIEELDFISGDLGKMLKKLGIKEGSEADRQIFLAGDKTAGAARNTRPLTAEEARGERAIHALYEMLIRRLNPAEEAAGLKPTAYLEGYAPHMWAESWIDEIFGFDSYTPAADALRQAGGKRQPFFGHRIFRSGKSGYEESAIGAMKAYLPVALLRIHMLEQVAKARKMVDALPSNLPNAKAYLNNWLDAGAFHKLTESEKAWLYPDPDDAFGTKVIKGSLNSMVWLSRLLTQSILRGAWTVAAVQPTGSILAFAHPDIGIKYSLMGIVPTVKQGLERIMAIGRPKYNLVQALPLTFNGFSWGDISKTSRVLKSHRATGIENIGAGSNVLTKIIDMPVHISNEMQIQHIHNSAMLKATRDLKLPPDEAAKYADDLTARIGAVYDRVYTSPAARHKINRALFFQFQTWLNRNFNEFVPGLWRRKDISTIDKLAVYAKIAGGVLAMNSIYKAIGLPTPFPGIQDFVPAGGALSSLFGEDEGGRSITPATIKTGKDTMTSAYDVAYDLLGDSVATPAEREAHFRKLARNGIILGLGKYGGRQFSNYFLGGLDAIRGKTLVTKGGKPKYAPLTTSDAIRGILLGPGNTNVAQKAYNPQGSYLTGQGILARLKKRGVNPGKILTPTKTDDPNADLKERVRQYRRQHER